MFWAYYLFVIPNFHNQCASWSIEMLILHRSHILMWSAYFGDLVLMSVAIPDNPDSKVHRANMGPRSAPCWPREPCYLGIFPFGSSTAIFPRCPHYRADIGKWAFVPLMISKWWYDMIIYILSYFQISCGDTHLRSVIRQDLSVWWYIRNKLLLHAN